MGFDFTINSSELQAWIDKQGDKTAKRKGRRAVMIVIENLLQDEAEKISATNNLTRSIEAVGSGDNWKILSANYGIEALETGRRPGKRPPVEHLAIWARKKGIKINPHALAKTIANRGTMKYRKKGPKQITAVAEEIKKNAVKKALEQLADAYL